MVALVSLKIGAFPYIEGVLVDVPLRLLSYTKCHEGIGLLELLLVEHRA